MICSIDLFQFSCDSVTSLCSLIVFLSSFDVSSIQKRFTNESISIVRRAILDLIIIPDFTWCDEQALIRNMCSLCFANWIVLARPSFCDAVMLSPNRWALHAPAQNSHDFPRFGSDSRTIARFWTWIAQMTHRTQRWWERWCVGTFIPVFIFPFGVNRYNFDDRR